MSRGHRHLLSPSRVFTQIGLVYARGPSFDEA
jgi:hypothetical protein